MKKTTKKIVKSKGTKKSAKKVVLKDVKSFVVDRKKWYRGKGEAGSSLLNQQGKMCCLGFYAISCGLKPEQIKHLPAPDDAVRYLNGEEVQNKLETFVQQLEPNMQWETKLVDNGDENTDACISLMAINDDSTLTPKVREKELTKEFKKIGIKVVFKN